MADMVQNKLTPEQRKMMDDMRINAAKDIQAAKEIIEFHRNAYVLMIDDGSVLHGTPVKDANLRTVPIGRNHEQIIRRETLNGKAELEKLLKHLREVNPDNHILKKMKVGLLKHAAQASIDTTQQLVAFMDKTIQMSDELPE